MLGAVLALGAAFCTPPAAAAATKSRPAVATGKTSAAKAATAKKPGRKPAKRTAVKKAAGKHLAGKNTRDPGKPGPLADFRGTRAAPEVVQVANWASYTRNNRWMPFIVIDKKNAQVYLFDENGKLKDHAPALLGEAVGDDNPPGIGNKPLSKIGKHEKITPAGRYLASRGKDNHGDDVIWIDYDAAVSMHRMHQVSADERRAERLSSPESSDNRISYGCVNLPPKFFDSVLRPTVTKYGAIIYVLPETRTPQQQFGAYDVTKGTQLAQAASPAS